MFKKYIYEPERTKKSICLIREDGETVQTTITEQVNLMLTEERMFATIVPMSVMVEHRNEVVEVATKILTKVMPSFPEGDIENLNAIIDNAITEVENKLEEMASEASEVYSDRIREDFKSYFYKELA